MKVVRHEIDERDLADPHSAINTLPRITLRSWGFDPDGDFLWWQDLTTGKRVIEQEQP